MRSKNYLSQSLTSIIVRYKPHIIISLECRLRQFEELLRSNSKSFYVNSWQPNQNYEVAYQGRSSNNTICGETKSIPHVITIAASIGIYLQRINASQKHCSMSCFENPKCDHGQNIVMMSRLNCGSSAGPGQPALLVTTRNCLVRG